MGQTLQHSIEAPDRNVVNIDLGEVELSQIWQWNDTVPTSTEACVHDLTQERCRAQPDAQAVCAWDGELTYGELDEQSTRLAQRLVGMGVGPEVMVPLCFEKSVWMVVAMLGVMKAGGACVPLDVATPSKRLLTVVQEVGATVIIISPSLADDFSGKLPHVITDVKALTEQWVPPMKPVVRPKAYELAFVMFTSGSTGRPKGVLLEHAAICTSILAQANAMKITERSRYFQFASYSFDVSIGDIFATLFQGGCVCIPSEHERVNDLAQVMGSLRVNQACLTPTVATHIDPRLAPTLRSLTLGGEAMSDSSIRTWAGEVNLRNVYGPVECSIWCLITKNVRSGDIPTNIGRAMACVSWVVALDNHDRLAPMGTVGELLIEGPLLARGYLHDGEKTAAAFIEDPPWLLAGNGPSQPGRRGRLYKTGDLVRYHTDGTLIFSGRKDTQVKIRGQRVELGEVEHHVQQRLPEGSEVVAEMIVPVGSDEPTLAVFVKTNSESDVQPLEESEKEMSVAQKLLTGQTVGLSEALADMLPRYMIPSAYIALATIPLTVSGKTDRKRLRETGAAMTVEELAKLRAADASKRAPTTSTEHALRRLWSMTLGMVEASIGADDSYFQLGGDSIAAMKLVAAARSEGLLITVADVFRRPKLCDMALLTIKAASSDKIEIEIAPFTLWGGNAAIEEVRADVARQCGVEIERVEDIHPCTALQEGLMALSAKKRGAYVAQMVIKLPAMVELNRVRAAWDAVVASSAILRTRIVQIEGHGLVQAVLEQSANWAIAHNLEEYLAEDSQQPMALTTPLTRLAITEDQAMSQRHLVWTAHHATYDGWSIELILQRVNRIYQGERVNRAPPYKGFLKYLGDIDRTAAKAFWRSELEGANKMAFPHLPSHGYQPQADSVVERLIQVTARMSSGITTATLIRGAWSVLMKQLSGSDDVVFGVTATGRNAPVAGIEKMEGPTFTSLPVQVRVDEDMAANDFLQAVQAQATALIEYEQIGLQNIRRLSDDAATACDFQVLLVIQPEGSKEQNDEEEGQRSNGDSGGEMSYFNTYAIMLVFQLIPGGVITEASFDARVVGVPQMQMTLGQLECVMKQLVQHRELKLRDIDCLDPDTKAQIWQWNETVPATMEVLIHDLIQERCRAQPEAQAVCAWDGELTYGELDETSTRLAQCLVGMGVGPEVMVPLCFEKSRWTVVAMLGVMKAGGAFVLLDAGQPEARLQTIVSETRAQLVLSSAQNEAMSSRLAPEVAVVPNAIMERSRETEAAQSLPCGSPSAALFAVFTSGSTGKPKGVVITHANYASCTHYWAALLGYDHSSRMLDFASYNFDASIDGIVVTLCHGGCVCVLSDSDRLNDLAALVKQLKVNMASLTPTVARLLVPHTVPSLRSLELGGEPMLDKDLQMWAAQLDLANCYGSAECSGVSTVLPAMSINTDARNIGRGAGCVTWVVDPANHERLMPIGAVGELLIEGPTVGRGYLYDREKTAAAFIEDPPWLLAGNGPSQPGRRGRLYKTGDLVRYHTDGTLIFSGRKDTQVKIRGQRVELGEVEHHVQQRLPEGSEVVAEVIVPASGSGEPTLVAFVSLAPRNGEELAENVDTGKICGITQRQAVQKRLAEQTVGLSETLAEVLPRYMVPLAYIAVVAMPSTVSDKTDRKRLHEMGAAMTMEELAELQAAKASKRAPTTATERVLQEIWAQTLNVPRAKISVDDSFTSLGGDSISAMQIVSRCRTRGIIVSVSSILRFKTIHYIAPTCKSNVSARMTSPQHSVGTYSSLSPIQRLYFDMEPQGQRRYHQSFPIKLKREVTRAEMAQALNLLVDRHLMLRARFRQDAEHQWKQIITDQVEQSYRLAAYAVADISEVQSIVELSHSSLHISHGPVFSVDLVEVPKDNPMLFMVAHHLVIDFVSWRIIWQDLETILQMGKLPSTQSISFQDWCQHQENYCQQQVQVSSTLPVSIPPADYSFWTMDNCLNTMGDAVEEHFTLDSHFTSLLLGTSNESLRTDALDILLATILRSFQSTFPERAVPAVFIEGHGRETWDDSLSIEETVGWFTTLYPLYIDIGGSDTILEVLRQLKDQRRSVPDNGRRYFACRYLLPHAAQQFEHHAPIELAVNYAGIFQQLEATSSLLELDTRAQIRNLDAEPLAHRLALIEIEIRVERGSMTFTFNFNQHMAHQDRLRSWIRVYQNLLEETSSKLALHDLEYTLSDFPLLHLTYKSFDTLMKQMLPEMGLHDLNEIEDVYPCTMTQEGILFSQQKDCRSYQIACIWEFSLSDAPDTCRQDRIEAAWQSVVDRHPVLRTVIVEGFSEDGHFLQVVMKKFKALFSEVEESSNDSEVILRDLASSSLDHRQAHMPRLTLLRASNGIMRCRIDASHVTMDGESFDLLFRDFCDAYFATRLPSPVPRYSEYVKYEQSLPAMRSTEYWARYMTNVQPCLFPLLSRGKSEDPRYQCHELEAYAANDIRDFCQRVGVTQSALFQTAWSLVLTRYTGKAAVCFGYLASGRDAPIDGINDAVGLFVSMLICRLRSEELLMDALHRVQDDTVIGLEHRNCSLASIHSSLGLQGIPLFNTCMTVRNDAPEYTTTMSSESIRMVGGIDRSEYAIVVNGTIGQTATHLSLTYDTTCVSTKYIHNIGSTLSGAMKAIMREEKQRVRDIDCLDPDTKAQIWRWNETVPASVEACVHDLIQERCRAQPEAQAVCAWDGELTYGELDEQSTHLAQCLVRMGVKPEVIVPLCFEKSKWTIVAMLGVMKAGGAFVLLDAGQPEARLQTIINETKAQLMLSSAQNEVMSSRLATKVVVVPNAALATIQEPKPAQNLPCIAPDAALYVVFTSGSTGTPKGVVITHANYTSGAHHRAPLLGFDKSTRMLDFASYSFDVSINCNLATFCSGGCVCVLSDLDRSNDLAGPIKHMNVNTVSLTSTMARLLTPKAVPTLTSLQLAGEPISDIDIEMWADHLNLINNYGPAECSAPGTSHVSVKLGSDPANLGRGVGCATWVVDPANHERLMPIGAVGELLIEGPTVGRGYLYNGEKTAAAFIEDPPWLLAGNRPSQPGRRGRLYKTGDLVRYHTDGTLIFSGRKDTQVKIRGQRVELGEVEHHVQQRLPEGSEVVAEVIVPAGGSGEPTLAAFVKLEMVGVGEFSDKIQKQAAQKHLVEQTAGLSEALAGVLPRYMVPSAYIAVTKMPLTVSGKTDRKRLREIAAALTIEELAALRAANPSKRAPTTATEHMLRRLWSATLSMVETSVGAEDNFFQLGGDSIAAMKLVAAARSEGLLIAVADVFRQPKLCDMASLTMQAVRVNDNEIAPFTLLGANANMEEVRADVARQCEVEMERVEDVYPCTALQEGLMALSTKKRGAYIAQTAIKLPEMVELDRVQAAWDAVVASSAILRTHIVQVKGHGLVQAVLKQSVNWATADNLKAYLAEDGRQLMELAVPLTRLAIVKDQATGQRHLVWTAHHATYDGWSTNLILQRVDRVYQGEQIDRAPPYKRFLKYLGDIDRTAADAFWRSKLKGAGKMAFPYLPSHNYQPQPNSTVKRLIEVTTRMSFGITTANLIWAAWSVLMTRLSGSDDVVFGVTASGRSAPVAGIEQIEGPTFTTLPVRVQVDKDLAVHSFLQAVQKQATALMEYEQVGLQNIRRLSDDAANACDFQTLLVIQPEASEIQNDKGPDQGLSDDLSNELSYFNIYAIMLVCRLGPRRIMIEASFDTRVIEAAQMQIILSQLECAIIQLIQNQGVKLKEIDYLDLDTKAQIWRWNETVPAPVKACVHSLIQDQCWAQPEAQAVCAWDGELTYGELDEQSTYLAQRLVAIGVGPDIIVPLCFEKSRWTVIAMLAVMKAGGAFVLMDASQPEARLQTIINETKAQLMLSSAQNEVMSSRLATKVVVVPNAALATIQEPKPAQNLPYIAPDAALYVVFTSGSTGTPKGVVITHANYASGAYHRAPLLDFNQTTRMLDFASYSFDVSIDCNLAALCSGGCVCILSDSDRLNDLTGSVKQMKVNTGFLTPTVARLLTPKAIPNFVSLQLAGEPVSDLDVAMWANVLKLAISCGPSECSVTSTLSSIVLSGTNARNLGRGVGCVTWVVDPTNHEQLMPIGAVGELLIEGPIVGRGYLHDGEKTAAAFIEDPPWLLAGNGPSQPGRRGRLYKTGDLVRYHTDGTLIFSGRKDMQVKIRGQRVELGEVEHYIQQRLPEGSEVVAEVIVPAGGSGELTLVAFVKINLDSNLQLLEEGETEMSTAQKRLIEQTAGLSGALAEKLPRYMIPSAYIALTKIPLTVSGKTDRKRLRETGAAMTVEELAKLRAADASKRAPTTATERVLRRLWSMTLGLVEASIGADDSFFQLGGDSIAAMRLVGVVREQRLSLTVADVFKHPRLCDLAEQVKLDVDDVNMGIEPFSLLKPDLNVEYARARAATLCSLESEQVKDIFPCTPLQEGLMAMTAKRAGDYVARMTFELDETVDTDRLETAWQEMVATASILRTRIIDLAEQGLVQVITNEPLRWLMGHDDLHSYTQHDEKHRIELGKPLNWVGIVKDGLSGRRFLVWTMHHALYDGWSLPLMLREVERMYWRSPQRQQAPFQFFVRHILDVNADQAFSYWRSQLADCEAIVFPELPQLSYQPRADQIVQHQVTNLQWPHGDITASTIVRAGCSLLIARHTDSNDVVFGATVTGRQVAVPWVDVMMGPTIATVPVRVSLDWAASISDFLQAIQTQALDMIPFEHTGVQRIRRINAELERSSQFQTLLMIQPQEHEVSINNSEKLFRSTEINPDATSGLDAFNTYGMMVACQLKASGLNLRISFDSTVISATQARRFARQLEHTLRQLSRKSSQSMKVKEVETLSEQDLQDIWNWNATVPAAVNACVHDMITEQVQKQPTAPAICAWNGELAYSELEEQSTRLAQRLVGLGVIPGQIVPLCFEKSMWMPVAMLGVMKAGGVSFPIDTTILEDRLRMFARQVRASLTLSSVRNEDLARRLADGQRVVVIEGQVEESSFIESQRILPKVDPSNPIYVVFTSGSTGTPKGIVISHQNFSSAILHQRATSGIENTSRVYDFVSYAFDMAWYNFLKTMTYGGCLCIPSEADLKNNIIGSMNTMNVTFVSFTPSVARLIKSSAIPSLTTLAQGGEPLAQEDICNWASRITLYHGYGPAECTPSATLIKISSRTHPVRNIGRGQGLVTWVVSTDGQQLAPIGAVGELWLEGPLVGQGYLNDPEKTSAAFVSDPSWLLRGSSAQNGRRGRLYRTGDLVRYDIDGSLIFIGRNDSQVKIRGQRVELGEVETHVLRGLTEAGISASVTAELITPVGNANAMLVAFVSLHFNGDKARAEVHTTLTEAIEMLDERLAELVPAYMIPKAYVPVKNLPITATGKTDRRQLREMGGSMTLQHLTTFKPLHGRRRQPETGLEQQLQRLWARVVGIESSSISADDSFLRVGGDSIAAMKLVAAARSEGLLITVADVFRRPKLCDMALFIAHAAMGDEGEIEVAPFTLLGGDVDKEAVRVDIAQQCGVEVGRIEDIYPCTAQQEGLMALSTKKRGAYIAQMAIKLPEMVELDRVRAAWDAVVASSAILRTRIMQVEGHGLVQAVLEQNIRWATADCLKAYLAEDGRQPMELAMPLTRLAIIEDQATGQRHLVWTAHHATYDGWSIELILQRADRIYKGERVDRAPSYKGFLKYLSDIDRTAASAFWRSELKGASKIAFPYLPSHSYQPQADSAVRRLIKVTTRISSGITTANLIWAAWSVLMTRLSGSDDVVFGVTASGRSAPVAGIEQMEGPTFTTLPIRVQVDKDLAVHSFLQAVQKQATALIEYEQVGLQNIRRLSDDAAMACDFQTLLVIQPEGSGEKDNKEADQRLSDNLSDELSYFNTYAIMLVCHLVPGGIMIEASFDACVIEAPQMQMILSQLECAMRQLVQHHRLNLRDIDCLDPDTKAQIWRWNETVPASVEACVHDLIQERCRAQPEAQAVCAWDGELTYGELDEQSTRLAQYLIKMGVGPEVMVLLCFEKSRWTVVSLLGVMKAGGAFVLLDASQPEGRLRAIADQVQARLVLSSAKNEAMSSRLTTEVVVVPGAFLEKPREAEATQSLPCGSPSAALYVVFTSGSTGKPKGVVITHASYISGVQYRAPLLGFDQTIRMLDFASYSFDMSIDCNLAMLCAGGCICVLSDSERSKDLAKPVKQMGVNTGFLTPTVARLLTPSAVPNLISLQLGGEPASNTDIAMWTNRLKLVISCGPSECSVISIMSSIVQPNGDARNLGRGVGCVTWVVDPTNHEQLMPIGTVGELLIEGPIVGRGYLYDREKTAAAFIEDPPWLLAGNRPSQPGRRGRLYKTGDLVRYHTDGTLIFSGRKDTQVKIRGQRVELGEVEHHIQQRLPEGSEVVAEVIVPAGGSGEPTLVTFVKTNFDSNLQLLEEGETEISTAQKRLIEQTAGLSGALAEILPRYMIPSAYIALTKIPLTVSGKTDRKRLRETGAAMTVEELAKLRAADASKRAPTTATERALRRLWAAVLGLAEALIGVDDSFFQLGGDSILAMKLMAAARSEGLLITVANIFRQPKLSDMATCYTPDTQTQGELSYQPFSSLCVDDVNSLVTGVVHPQIKLQQYHVEDVFPTTEFQDYAIRLTHHKPRSKLLYILSSSSAAVNVHRLAWACCALVRRRDALRTIFVSHNSSFLQVVLRDLVVDIPISRTDGSAATSAKKICAEDAEGELPLGSPCLRFWIVQQSDHGICLIIRLSHAQYDGVSIPLILHDLQALYAQKSMTSAPSFARYISSKIEGTNSQCAEYWRSLLKGSMITQLPSQGHNETKLSLGKDESQSMTRKKTVPLPFLPPGITLATLISAAWASTISHATSQHDVVFGQLVSGRNMSIPSIDNIVGTCINIVPVRVQLQTGRKVLELLSSLQDQKGASAQFEHCPLTDIVKNSTEWPKEARLGWIAQHQNIDEIHSMSSVDVDSRVEYFVPHPSSQIEDEIFLVTHPLENHLQIEVTGRKQRDRLMKETLENLSATITSMSDRLK